MSAMNLFTSDDLVSQSSPPRGRSDLLVRLGVKLSSSKAATCGLTESESGEDIRKQSCDQMY